MATSLSGMRTKKFRIRLRHASDEEWRRFAQQAEFNVQKLALLIGVSTRHAERLVRSKFNLSPREYLRRERMLAARGLLQQAESIKEISFALGYSHPSVFNRHFKQFYGVTPTQCLMSG